MKNGFLSILLFASTTSLFAETLVFTCVPHRDHETPYRTFHITILNADSNDPKSEISFSLFSDNEALVPDSAGILDGFYQEETYATYLSSRYRQITIQGGKLGFTWQRDQLSLNKKRGTAYRGSFLFPEGSEQLDLNWNALLDLDCTRIQ